VALSFYDPGEPTVETIAALADALDISLGELFTRAESE